MSLDLPSQSNNDGSKRNLTPESDSGMNSQPTGDDDSSVGSEMFDQNVVATSTPHRIVDDVPQPPNILEDLLNTSGDSHKENYISNISDDRSATDNGPLTDALYRDGPGALLEHLFNTNSFKGSQSVDVYSLEQEIKHLREENNKLQQAYKVALIESTEKTHTITYQETQIKNLEALAEEQEKVINENEECIKKLNNDCKKIPEFVTQIKNLHSMMEKQNFSFEIQKDQFLKLQENNKELSQRIRNELSEEFSDKIKHIEEEKTDLKRKLSHAEENVEKTKKKMKDISDELEISERNNKHLKDRVKKLSSKPSVVDVGLQTDIPNVVNERRASHSIDNPGETSLDILYAGVKTPVRNTDFSNTIFTTPGIGDQTMWNRISHEAQEMFSVSQKLKMVVDFLKEEQGGAINENVKHKIIEETTKIIDAEFLKHLKKIIQPLQIFRTLANAQKQDLAVAQQEKDKLLKIIEKNRSSMEIIAKEFEINCHNNDGQLNITNFWNGLSLYVNELKKVVVNNSKNETKTTFNGLTPLHNNMKNFNTPKEVFTTLHGGKISPILYNGQRNDMIVKDDKENLLKDIFEKYGEAKEELAKYKQNFKQLIDEKKELMIKHEKKFNEYNEIEKKYERSVSELKEIVEKTQKEYVNSQTNLKRAKKLIQRLGSSYQEHFNLYHKDMKIDSAVYDCFSVLKHTSEYMKHK